MDMPKLYRKRYIPDENIRLKDDIIVLINEDIIVTKWRALKPRSDFERGISCYYLKNGYKVSKFINREGKCIYIYCDIIESDYHKDSNSYIFNDLLIDVIIYADNSIRVVDTSEVADALEEGLITQVQAMKALRCLDKLLNIIYDGKLGMLLEHMEGIS